MTCRFCKKTYYEERTPMLKYGTRHYAHYECYLRRFSADGFTKLSLWKLRQFPYLMVKRLGLMEALESAIEGKCLGPGEGK